MSQNYPTNISEGNVIVLFRKSTQETKDELEVCKKYFNTVENRTKCYDSFVIGRYSVAPYYRELELDLKNNNSTLINTYSQYLWIANFDYYSTLLQEGLNVTPKSYTSLDFYKAPEGRFVVKGCTSSMKFKWSTHMFAANKRRAVEIGHDLRNDGLLCDQATIYREFVPLKIFCVDEINGQPYTNEWRMFFYRKTLLSYGYYWSNLPADKVALAYIKDEAFKLAEKIATVASENTNFYVMDIAEKEDGGWILVEMNEGQCSGLSMNDPEILYSALKKEILTN